MRALGELLRGWKPSGRAPRDPMTAIVQMWPEIAGEKIAANSRPQSIERDTLLVTTRSNAWSQQLSFLSENIIAALHERGMQPEITRLRFRVGRMTRSESTKPARKRQGRLSEHRRPHEPASTVHEALARFRADIEAFQRAKHVAGWNLCMKCGAAIAPSTGTLCPTCADADMSKREGLVERLLFETPWLGYDGIAQIVEGLTRTEYNAVRVRLLARWWDILRRVERTGHLSSDGHERLIASSYVLLKSGVAPELVAPATVRNLLGDRVHDAIYGSP